MKVLIDLIIQSYMKNGIKDDGYQQIKGSLELSNSDINEISISKLANIIGGLKGVSREKGFEIASDLKEKKVFFGKEIKEK